METSTTVYIWWGFMSGIAVLNMVLLYFTYRAFTTRKEAYSPLVFWVRKRHLILAAIYVFGCAFRSFFPRGDVQRIVLVDHWISAVAIGRSVATIAELSFAAQWALMLYEVGKATGNKTILTLSKLIVPMLVVAECFSWYACTTGNFLGSVIEESLWALSAALLIAGYWLARPFYTHIQRRFINIVLVSGLAYVIYMVTVDVPSYIRKFKANQAAGKEYSTVINGLIETATVWHQTHAYSDWQYAMVWMTLYFSTAVWASMIIVNGPAMDKGLRKT